MTAASSALAESPAPAQGRPVPQHDLPELESLRALAALMVVTTHVGFETGHAIEGNWAGWLARMDFGVALFFLLSGFLLFRPHIRYASGLAPKPRVGDYFAKRALRLLPAMYVAMGAAYLLFSEVRENTTWQQWLGNIFLVQNYFEASVISIPALAQLWSLCVEASFYVAVPFLAWLAFGRAAQRNWLIPMLLGLWVFSLVWRVISEGFIPLLVLPAFIDWFAAGMYLAWLNTHPRRAPRILRLMASQAGASWGLAFALLWLVTPKFIGGPYTLEAATAAQSVFKHEAYLVAAFFMLLPVALGDPAASWRRWATHPTLLWLGTVSYGLFLWHTLILKLVFEALGINLFTGHFWLLWVPTVALSLVAAGLSWYLVERPFQRLRRQGPLAVARQTIAPWISTSAAHVRYAPLDRAAERIRPMSVQPTHRDHVAPALVSAGLDARDQLADPATVPGEVVMDAPTDISTADQAPEPEAPVEPLNAAIEGQTPEEIPQANAAPTMRTDGVPLRRRDRRKNN